jgi:hypothetical protein
LIPPRSVAADDRALLDEIIHQPLGIVHTFPPKAAVEDDRGACAAPLEARQHEAQQIDAHRPRAADVVGVITKRAVADAVIDNYAE